MRKVVLCFFNILVIVVSLSAQSNDTSEYWHGIERNIRYQPQGQDFVITNGNRRFTRALYGSNTAFRVEAGDLPEFALYLPGMGGNFKLGLSNADSSKWLIKARSIKATYRPGSMLYEIEDGMLGNGKIHVVVLAMANAEGMIIKASFENVLKPVQLIWAFGGASGKKFSRDGDMGPDPESSFYLKPENCIDNRYAIQKNTFKLFFGSGLVTTWDPYVNKIFDTDTVSAIKIGKEQMLEGVVPPVSSVRITDATALASPTTFIAATNGKAPAITGSIAISNKESYFFAIKKPEVGMVISYPQLPILFANAEAARKAIADRIQVTTPDKWINTLGAVLSTAADAIWESPTYLHGSIGWRMRLNGWRGPYVADVLGWHDRAKTHFKAYALSQVTSPESGPVIMDTALHLARSLEKMGVNMYTSGYISRNPNGDIRPHHYDMNLVYIDGLIRHLYWTADTAFAKDMWPVLTRHLAWEKRNFDSDNDGLYDAYAAIWASDALQYSGGAVTHSSAYNYLANKEAAAIAKLIGEDGTPYEVEAAKIYKAINRTLWLPENGNYAEYKDLLGNAMLHKNPAVWSIYHALDSKAANAFQAYQSVKYVTDKIPHIPVRAKGLEKGYYTISTSKWMPYDWSINNVATAEVMHTALAYWQAGLSDKAFNLWKSELLSTMYLGGSPGNIGQISFYDAARGEAYRDFADPIAMTARSLVEGLFGITPNAIKGECIIQPGFPKAWNDAAITTPDIALNYKRLGKQEVYTIVPSFPTAMRFTVVVPAKGNTIKSLSVNGKNASWENVDSSVGVPKIRVGMDINKKYVIKIVWGGELPSLYKKDTLTVNTACENVLRSTKLLHLYDPQQVLNKVLSNGNGFSATTTNTEGNFTVFMQVQSGMFTWWQPWDITLRNAITFLPSKAEVKNAIQFRLQNNSPVVVNGSLQVNNVDSQKKISIQLQPWSASKEIVLFNNIVPGTNRIQLQQDIKNETAPTTAFLETNWNITNPNLNLDFVNLAPYFNDKVSNIFKNTYLSPRPKVATLQLPTQGIGDWTHPLKTAAISDAGLRHVAGVRNQIQLPQGIVFKTPSDSSLPNILFTSQWDNYPKTIEIPLNGTASHVYLLMAGSTNPMQSRIVNGSVMVTYMDGSVDSLLLKNPETWWPIDQDYMDDGYAFQVNAAIPPRVHLKTGKITSTFDGTSALFNGKPIDGGAATVLDLPLQQNKKLKSLIINTVANDVVIGLMAASLIR